MDAVYIAMQERVNQKLGQNGKSGAPQLQGPQPG
jgi:hypothetical protein